MNPYSRIIARLDGERLSREPEVYIDLVRKGIAGFIVFGGDLERLREGLFYLKDIADIPLIVGSDLEQGLGQQVRGGTTVPSAMAMGSALLKDPSVITLIEEAFREAAREALYAGINTIFAPVMDIQSNPSNPIISIRAFGTEPEIVSFLGSLMIRSFEDEGIFSCAKHFPGHGDTDIDSHHGLPVIRKSLKELLEFELIPFRSAVESRVSMVMMGHLMVPAIDPVYPVSISKKAVRFLRDMGFDGIIVTDAFNMGALSGYSETEAVEIALSGGVDLILHPSDPDSLARGIKINLSESIDYSKKMIKTEYGSAPDFERGRLIAREIYQKALNVSGEIPIMRSPLLVILDEELSQRSGVFINKTGLEEGNFIYIKNEGDLKDLSSDREILLVVYSRPGAFKRKRLRDFDSLLEHLSEKARLIIVFGNPFILKDRRNKNVLYIYDDTETAQTVVADFLRPFISY